MDFNKIEKIYPLSNDDLSLVTDLLKSFCLPVSDLEIAPVKFFGIKGNRNLIASGGLEIYGKNAILRSVAIDKNYQGRGLGIRLTHYIEAKAAELGIKRLFLLTTTAERFFKNLNYQFIERNSCPDEIKLSAEFKEICPSTASCLYKDLTLTLKK